MSLTLGLKALGIGKTLFGWLRSLVRWIFSDWRHIVIAVLSLVAAYQFMQAGKYHRQADRAVAALERANNTISDMKAASAKAKTENDARVARINAENERKADNAKRDYQARLASNNAVLDSWLRKTNRGASGTSGIAQTATGPTGIVEAGPEADVPEKYALVPIADLELTAQAYATLEALQHWARDVGEVAD
jgi:type II secretory pathway pseudopilin PulG